MVWNGSSVTGEKSSMLSDENSLLCRFRAGLRSRRREIREFERILSNDEGKDFSLFKYNK